MNDAKTIGDALLKSIGTQTPAEMIEEATGTLIGMIEGNPVPKKPPIGIVPESIFEDGRIKDLIMACARSYDAGYMPDEEWLGELRERLRSRHCRSGNGRP